ncbi:TonB family protein [Sporomusa acidovorans]|uniref:TonB C-terminal domain-containing protein n=1 Tax=Sporomusa acidovorans (strain ATCC 49682 / DSM 3132 / Mol) TaxID=1123286 RepID=A0ABZ3J9F0_SPOA4|nr:TonB family protein [Sporomusa acidovorans]OZC16029.1 gram-negative bacterial tonB protein [Sporomusa acidovorans DSM 3132]SDD89203.1 TonB family C-terminal domain-containing protein [Sporomusa acidovorans]
MNRKRFVIIATLLFFIIGVSLTVFAEEPTDNKIPERPDPKDVIHLKLISHSVYFPQEIKQKYSGQDFLIVLRFQVSAYGYVKDVNVYVSSGYSDLDDTLVESAKNFIFTPTYIKNKPVDSVCRVPIKGTVPAPDIDKGQ